MIIFPENKEHKLIQSYVADKFFVSTAYRRASTEIEMWYYETAIWAWDKETKKRGTWFGCYDSGSIVVDSLYNHLNICKILIENDNENEEILQDVLSKEIN
jgi:hypothetical protein